MKKTAMARIINFFPLFPVNVIVFPGEIHPLHIFEERYKTLIKDMKEKNDIFGIPYVKNGKMCLYGSGVMLHKVLSTSPSGEMDILVRGGHIFKIDEMNEELPGKLYPGGKVKRHDEMNEIANHDLIRKFRKYKEQLRKINDENAKAGVITSNNILDIAGQMALDMDEKYNIIKLKSKSLRENFLLGKLDFLLMINEKLKEIGYRFYLN